MTEKPEAEGEELRPDVHPSVLPATQFERQCEFHRTKRSGPGGQHRNKVESAIVVTHRPTSIRAEAGERRSQHENRRVALQRLRLRVALQHRSSTDSRTRTVWQQRLRAEKISVSVQHHDFAALVAEGLDAAAAHRWQMAAVASELGTSTSQLIKFLKQEPSVWQHVNQQRLIAGLAELH